MQRQQVNVHYRRLVDMADAFGGMSLEAAVRKAMATHMDGGALSEHWKRRAWIQSTGGADTLLMNLYHDGSSHFFGDLTQYTKGYMQALLTLKEDEPMLAVEQQPPGEGKEFVHSMAYWMIKGNHAFIIQSRSISTKQLEEYFTWLIKDRTATVGPLGLVILQVKFDPAQVGGDLDDIQEIVVGGNATLPSEISLATPESERSPEEVEAYHELDKRKSWRDRAVNVLRAIMSNEADVQKFLESIPSDAALEVSVHIGYKTRRRKMTRVPMQQALRNLPDGEIKARGRQGSLSGEDIRLSYPANVKRLNSLLDPVDVERALLEAYDALTKNGKIEA